MNLSDQGVVNRQARRSRQLELSETEQETGLPSPRGKRDPSQLGIETRRSRGYCLLQGLQLAACVFWGILDGIESEDTWTSDWRHPY